MNTAPTLNLDPLVVAASGGDVDAFARLVSATSALVSSIALAIVRDLDLSKDLAQDVFLAAWRDLRTLAQPVELSPLAAADDTPSRAPLAPNARARKPPHRGGRA